MFMVTVAFGPQSRTWAFFYKTEEAAKQATSVIIEGRYISDDFGQHGRFEKDQIQGMLVEDLELSKEVHVEKALHEARIMAEAQQRAARDPALKRPGPGIAMPTGPAMISPGGFGRG